LLIHFDLLFSDEEKKKILDEYKYFKAFVRNEVSSNPNLSPFHVLCAATSMAESENFKNFALVIELMFAVSPSIAHIERSFSAMNLIKTKLRSCLTQDMLNKCMTICTSTEPFNAEEVLNLWLELSDKSKEDLQIGSVRIPSFWNIKKGYEKKKRSKHK
jgi:hypothetical protein